MGSHYKFKTSKSFTIMRPCRNGCGTLIYIAPVLGKKNGSVFNGVFDSVTNTHHKCPLLDSGKKREEVNQ